MLVAVGMVSYLVFVVGGVLWPLLLVMFVAVDVCCWFMLMECLCLRFCFCLCVCVC